MTKAQSASDYCTYCDYKVSQQPRHKVCKRCKMEIYSTEEGELCNPCKKSLCICGKSYRANGEMQCSDCLKQQTAEFKGERPDTASKKSSQTSKPKFIRCPLCVTKKMAVNKVPTSNLAEKVKCQFCTYTCTVKDILSFNKISDLSEMRFEGFKYE